MVRDTAFWKDLEARFRTLHDSTEKFRALRHGRRPWSLLGASKQREEVFRALARQAGIAAGVPSRASALDFWLDLLAENSPHSSGIVGLSGQPGDATRENDRKIENLWLASAEYCIKLATLSYELPVVATDAGRPTGLRRDRYPMASHSWLYDHDHPSLAGPKEERDYWKAHVLRMEEAVCREYEVRYLGPDFQRKEAVALLTRDISSAVMCLSYDLALLQANYVIDAGFRGEDATRAFHSGSPELLGELSSFRRVAGERMEIPWGDDTDDSGEVARSFQLVEGDLRSLLDQLVRPNGVPLEKPSLELHYASAIAERTDDERKVGSAPAGDQSSAASARLDRPDELQSPHTSASPNPEQPPRQRELGELDSESHTPADLPQSEPAQGMAEGAKDTGRATQEPPIIPPRKHGFEANMERHRAIAEIVSKHVPGWHRMLRRKWLPADSLKLICAELDATRDQSPVCEIPESWKYGTPDALDGARVNGWGETLDHAKQNKFIRDHLAYSLKMVLKKD